ncbi:hypothetical protein FS842_000229 [Serendipita sp. 407]|nr:hypothetical protein FS842_000229 [Serendipita sp. 407]
MTTTEPLVAAPPPMPPAVSTPPILTRQSSMRTVDMHIPGAWVGTNPGTPAPISEDLKYFGETLKTLPTTVQGYMPKKEDGSPATAGDLKEKAISMVPANVMNTVTNYLPASMQPTMSPTAADKLPEPTSTSNEDKPVDLSPTMKDRVAAIVPASAVNTAATYLPTAINPAVGPTAADAHPANHDDAKILPTNNFDHPPTSNEYQELEEKEATANKTWTEAAASILPTGTVGAISSYLPASLQPESLKREDVPTPVGTHENLNGPLPPVPKADDAVTSANAPLVGSTVSPDADVQEALSNAANPDQYKTTITSPTSDSISQPSERTIDANSVVASTQAVGGQTPVTPNSEAEGDGYPEHGKKGVAGVAALAAGGGIGAFAVDHGLKDQREAAIAQESAPYRPITSEMQTPQDSFAHVVIPATPGAGLNEREMFDQKAASGLSPKKSHKKDRSGSMSAGEASPSSPTKSGGVFSGIRKLTKKRDRSVSKGHSRDPSADHSALKDVPATGAETNSNSTGGSEDASPTSDKKERSVLHKDPPAGYRSQFHEGEENDPNYSGATGSIGRKSTLNTNSSSSAAQETQKSPTMLSNPFSPTLPPSSPTKVGLKDKIKGELMVVQGKLSRDESLKEAGEKVKKGIA